MDIWQHFDQFIIILHETIIAKFLLQSFQPNLRRNIIINQLLYIFDLNLFINLFS